VLAVASAIPIDLHRVPRFTPTAILHGDGSMVFKGQAEYSVDSKGRVAIPASMRSVMSPEAKGTFTVTRGLETCIFLYPLDEWSQIEAEIADLNTFNRESRRFVRRIMRWAKEVSLDKQGRVTLPKSLIGFAGLDDTALILGSFDHIEIWNPEHFDEYLNEDPDDYETLAEQVMG
jgi:MraZ protein